MNSRIRIGLFVVLLTAGWSLQAEVDEAAVATPVQVVALADQADLLVENGHFLAAAQQYQEAIELLPPPLSRWPACLWLTISLGDSYYLGADYPAALKALEQAMDCPGAYRNPYAHLRLGQVHLEMGDCERAADELSFALAYAGYEIFDDEPPKYLEFASNILSLQTQANGALHC